MVDEKEEKKPAKVKVNSLRREMSSFGGARSLIGQAKQGGNVIGNGIRVIGEATKKTMEPARFETFDLAMGRLDITEDELPIIHNQLVVQVYLTFVMACVALVSTVNLFFQGVFLGCLVALMIGVASFAKMIQSSMQCYFIRQRQLGIGKQWWSKSENWFPNRIEGLVKMAPNDPLREPRLVDAMARNARRNFKFALIVFLPGVLSYAVFNSIGWPLVSMTVSVAFILLGSSLSFEVYKRREGVICDLYPWLSSPKLWIPSAPSAFSSNSAYSSKSGQRFTSVKKGSNDDIIGNTDNLVKAVDSGNSVSLEPEDAANNLNSDPKTPQTPAF